MLAVESQWVVLGLSGQVAKPLSSGVAHSLVISEAESIAFFAKRASL